MNGGAKEVEREALEVNKEIFIRKLKAASEAGRLVIEQCQIMARTYSG